MVQSRIERLNSQLKRVISEVIRKEVHNPQVNQLTTVTQVSISKDLRHAHIYVSILGNEIDQKKTVEALQEASGFIGTKAAQKVVMRYFPKLTFRLDEGEMKRTRIEELLKEIHIKDHAKKNKRHEG